MNRILLAFSLIIAFTGCGTNRHGDFISVSDGVFQKDGEPYYYIGVNYWYGAILGSQGEFGDRERLIRELDHMKSIGIDNLRVLVGAEGPDYEPFRVTPALDAFPGGVQRRPARRT